MTPDLNQPADDGCPDDRRFRRELLITDLANIRKLPIEQRRRLMLKRGVR